MTHLQPYSTTERSADCLHCGLKIVPLHSGIHTPQGCDWEEISHGGSALTNRIIFCHKSLKRCPSIFHRTQQTSPDCEPWLISHPILELPSSRRSQSPALRNRLLCVSVLSMWGFVKGTQKDRLLSWSQGDLWLPGFTVNWSVTWLHLFNWKLGLILLFSFTSEE